MDNKSIEQWADGLFKENGFFKVAKDLVEPLLADKLRDGLPAILNALQLLSCGSTLKKQQSKQLNLV